MTKDTNGTTMSATTPSGGAPAILLVDDRKDNLMALRAILEPLKLTVDSSESGTDALRMLLEHDYALILLDVQMPGMDGFETASMIRQRPRSKLTPIVFVSAIHRSDKHLAKGYTLGAVDYIFKPVVPEILLAKVRVFCDLFEKNQIIARLAAEREVRELRRLSPQRRSDTAFEADVEYYLDPLHAFLDESSSAAQPSQIARALLSRQVSGKQLVEIHLEAMERLVGEHDGPYAVNAVHKGRLLLLGVLANLADLYQEQSNRVDSHAPPGGGASEPGANKP